MVVVGGWMDRGPFFFSFFFFLCCMRYAVLFAIGFLSMYWGRTGLDLLLTTGVEGLRSKSLDCGREVGFELRCSQMVDKHNGRSRQLLASYRVMCSLVWIWYFAIPWGFASL